MQPKPTRILPRATPAQGPLILQERRAAERGRGRKARAPLQIPWRRWKDIFVRTYYEILDDRLLALAAAIVFYSLVALFPAITAGVSVYGNAGQQSTCRTQSRASVSQALERMRQTFAVVTRGRSRMRESCMYGSARGAPSNGRPYRDRRREESGFNFNRSCVS